MYKIRLGYALWGEEWCAQWFANRGVSNAIIEWKRGGITGDGLVRLTKEAVSTALSETCPYLAYPLEKIDIE